MKFSRQKIYREYSLYILGTFFLLTPNLSFAELLLGQCSNSGYTIATINGVLTNNKGASDNMIALMDKVGLNHGGQEIDYQYLLNPIHSGGFGDLLNSVTQKAFENEVVADYDLIEMLKDASQKVKTQKLLLVAHSQGNFYANSFYDVATKQAGGVPAQSIGVYGVANPASRVAGEGKWLTSDTDKVITWVVGNVPFRKIKAPNAHIVLGPNDDFMGHDFALVYLPHVGGQIVKDIEESLSNLSGNTIQNNSAPCISPPEISLAHKQQGIVYAVTDPLLNPIGTGALWALGKGANGAMLAYNTGLNIANTVTQTTYAVSTTVYNAILAALTSGTVAGNNSAMAILATQPVQTTVPVNSSVDTTTNSTPQTTQPTTVTANASQKPQTVFVFEPKVVSGTNAPKLVFVGSFLGGSAQVMGSQAVVSVVEEVANTGEAIAGAGLPAPALSVPQCAQTLATDGCLLATTTVHFEWSNVAGADHYLLSKNGEYATTTENTFDTTIKDFSDYTFEVVAMGADGTASATSTQKVSVATIPIAINEIAWMGTKANWRDEWFEIKNNTSRTIDLSQWELNSKDSTPYVKLIGTIEPHGYLVFERRKDTVNTEHVVQATSTLLNDHGDQMTLFRDSVIFDQTPDGTWVAGATSTRQTMERYSSRESGADADNWGTNLGYIKNGKDAKGNEIEGTPGAQNSVSTLINKGQDIVSNLTLTNTEEQYVIPNYLRVSASSTLTISPGVDIRFYDGWIRVGGHLVVSGTQENPVTMGTFSGNQDGGISVGGGYVDTVYQGVNASATFDNVNIENINYISAYDNTRLDISNTNLLNSYGGIYAAGNAQISIFSSTIRNTQDNHAVAGYQNSKITIASSTITNTLGNDAIGVYNGTMAITNTTIDGAPNDGGIYAYRATLDISNSTIKNVSDTGMSLYRAISTISNVTIENADNVGIEVYQGQATIASTTISGVAGWAGISVDEAILSISSSTIRNVSDYGISTYKATTTISNTVVENGGGTGVDIYQGKSMITDTTVSGFGGSGISVYAPTEPVVIMGGEVTGNTVGVSMDAGSAILVDVSVHDNGTSEADNVVVW